MRTFWPLSILFTAIFVSGCASHQTIPAPALSYDLSAQQQALESEGVRLSALPIHESSKLETYFDADLIEMGILPVQVSLHNKDYPGNVLIHRDGFRLVGPDHASHTMLTVDQIVEKTKKSYWRTAGWTVAFGVFGLVPSAINVSNTNKKIRADYESRLLQEGNLNPGNMTEGFLFFPIPEKIRSLDGWELSVVLRDPNTPKDLAFARAFSGAVAERETKTNTPTSPDAASAN